MIPADCHVSPTLVGKRLGVSRQRAGQLLDPDKYHARMRVAEALKTGQLVRPAECVSCGSTTRIEAHHSDYSNPLGVEWLCVRCHKIRHVIPAATPQRASTAAAGVRCHKIRHVIPGEPTPVVSCHCLKCEYQWK